MLQTDKSKISNHPDYLLEEKHLSDTSTAIKAAIPELENEGFTINAWDTDVDIRSKRMVALHHRRKADALREVTGNPYFGRVDFIEDGINLEETFYLGRVGFNGPEPVQVVDWRAPKASVFYESQGGRAKYAVKNEVYYGDIILKRQFVIKDGMLENFFDSQILDTLTAELPNREQLITDDILRERLRQSTGNRLHDIVETIRADQNKIIREPLDQVTLVQGCAGSGKSTIALHRVSYLLYNYKSLDPQKIAVVAPNKLFLNYISGVLPGLELEEIKQLTFTALVEAILGLELDILPDNTSELLLRRKEEPGDNPLPIPVELTKFKNSLEFKLLLEHLVASDAAKFVDELQDIYLFNNKLVITKDEQALKFNEGNNPYNRRIDSLKKYISFRIDYFLNTSDLPLSHATPVTGSKDIKGYVQRIKDHYESKIYFHSKLNVADTNQRKLELRNQLTKELTDIKTQQEDFLASLSAKFIHLEIETVYSRAMSSLSGTAVPEGADPIQYLQVNLSEGKAEKSDLAPLCYLKYLLDGVSVKYQHIVVDEAQDLSPFEFALLKVVSRNSFSILGDLAQAISGFGGLDSWDVLSKDLFSGVPLKYFELTQSYRSTKEIVEFANQVIPAGLPRGLPVYRQGEQPKVENTESFGQTALRCAEVLSFYLSQGCKSVAIVFKNPNDGEKIYSSIINEGQQFEDLHLVTGKSDTYEGGISVIPISLVKGLEFDAAILWDASDAQFAANPLDAKMLFVALSRPLHYLHVFFTGKLTPLLDLSGD